MVWKESTVVEQRIRFVILAQSGAKSFSALCREFGIARKTGYKWLKRYAESSSFTSLNDQSRRPQTSSQRTVTEQEQRAVQLRQELGWGARKLQVVLAREGIQLSEATLNRIIKRNGLLTEEGKHRPATQRFERSRPNELWQIDFKGPICLEQERRCYPLGILDDHSRFLVGLFALSSTQAEPVRQVLRDTFQHYGLPEQIMTDHGTPFWSTTNAQGLTQLSVELLNHDIQLIHSGVRHPQTQGKVERLNLTLQAELEHRGAPRTLADCQDFFLAFRERYNRERPHEALEMAVPADRYLPSTRAYTAETPPWPYASWLTVVQLNAQGCLDYQRQRLFVCEALAHQWVGILAAEGKLLVQFRNMLIREIDLASRQGIAFVP